MSLPTSQTALAESYQEALARDPGAPPPPGLDPGLAETARLLARHLRPATPERAFVAALRAQVGGAGSARRTDARGSRPAAAAEGRLAPAAGPHGQARGRLPSASLRRGLAAACYVAFLLLLGGGAALLLHGRINDGANRSLLGGAVGTPPPGDVVIDAVYRWFPDGAGQARKPALSPDGRYAAYLPQITDLQTTRLLVRDLATGAERDLTPEPGYSYSGLRWAPDSRALAVVKFRADGPGLAAPAEVWRVAVDGSPALRLYTGDPGIIVQGGPLLAIARWSPDGRDVTIDATVAVGQGVRHELRRVHANGDGTSSALDPAPLTAAQCGAADGTQFGQQPAPTDDYALCAVATTNLRQPTGDAPPGSTTLVRYDYGTGRSQILGTIAGGRGFAPSIAPDGEWIAFQADDLWVVRRDGTGLHRVGGDAYQLLQGGKVFWADGGRAYFVALPTDGLGATGGDLYALDAATATARAVRTGLRLDSALAVARDGRRLLALRHGPTGAQPDAALLLLQIAPTPTR